MESGVTPVVADDAIVTRDGTRLPLRRWDAEAGPDANAGKPRAVIVALHGMSDYSNAFDMPGKVWAKLGITTLAYDQRGFGRSDNPGVWAGADAMRADLNDAVAAARMRYPGVPVFALGESMGGAVVLTALASAAPSRVSASTASADAPILRADASADAPILNVDGVILIAPAVWSRGDMPLTYRAALFLAAHLVPGMILSNSAAGRVVTIIPSDNMPMLRALGRDPLFQKKTRTATLFGLVNLMDEARTAPERMTKAPPILFLYGANDQIIPAKPTQAVIAALGAKTAFFQVKRYEHGWHMLLRDLEGESVDRDVADWIFRGNPGAP
jgi:acylglycerol lipase